MRKGFIRVPNRLFETKWWNKKRIYSESDAIIDLYSCTDKHNQLNVSIRTLADKWIWEQTKVLRFLTKLAKENYIVMSKSQYGTTITIVDFGLSATPTATPTATPSATPKKEKCNTETPINKGFDYDDCNTTNIKSATPSATLSATPTATYIYNNIDKEDNNIYIPPISPKGETDKSSKFKKPTIEDIEALITEKNYHFDATAFWNFYESKGWMVGKNHMKNWKAACATWERNRNRYGTTKEIKQPNLFTENPSDDQMVRDAVSLIDSLATKRRNGSQ